MVSEANEIAVPAGTAAVLIAGPTASGKSRLAMALASRLGGVVVNADSMQVYGEMRVLTARPSVEDEEREPHRLYGTIPASRRYSVGAWLDDIAATLADLRRDGALPIVVGGTGLYFKALTEGLSRIPPVPAEIRDRIAAEAADAASPDLHGRLHPDDAAVVRPSDRTRIVRALEVYAATGRSLAAWNRGGNTPPLVDPATAVRMVLAPDRAELHRRIAMRAEAMIAAGAIEEARAVGALGLPPAQPAMKAIGVRELLAHLAGDTSLDEAVAAIKTETRRYAKRQETWFRNQMRDWPTLDAGAGPA